MEHQVHFEFYKSPLPVPYAGFWQGDALDFAARMHEPSARVVPLQDIVHEAADLVGARDQDGLANDYLLSDEPTLCVYVPPDVADPAAVVPVWYRPAEQDELVLVGSCLVVSETRSMLAIVSRSMSMGHRSLIEPLEKFLYVLDRLRL
jgi:hypothetical protein